MDQKEYAQYSPERQKMFDEQFHKLSELDVLNIGKDNFLSKDGIPLNAIKRLKESEFVKEGWLLQFAVNDTSGENYFDYKKWGSISNELTMIVLIVKDDDPSEIIFAVKPFNYYETSARERDMLSRAAGSLRNSIESRMQNAAMGAEPDKIMEVAGDLLTRNSEIKRTPIQDLIPTEFYHKHNVYPESLRTVFYLKDYLLKGQVDKVVLQKIKEILDRFESGGAVEDSEWDMIKTTCDANKYGDVYHIPDPNYGKTKENHQDNNTTDEQPIDPDDFDPLSC